MAAKVATPIIHNSAPYTSTAPVTSPIVVNPWRIAVPANRHKQQEYDTSFLAKGGSISPIGLTRRFSSRRPLT